jgi:hypothetical protein
MSNAPSGGPLAASSKGETGWRWIQAAAAAILLLSAAGTWVSVSIADPRVRTSVAVIMGGYLLLRGLILYGAWQRALWAAWTGAVLAFLTVVPLVIASALVALSGAHLQLDLPPAAYVLVVGQGLANVAMIVGLVLVLSSRPHPPYPERE